jgi:hypothetical protein
LDQWFKTNIIALASRCHRRCLTIFPQLSIS